MTSAAESAHALLPPAMRDTALTVTSLADHATPASFKVLRQICDAQIARLGAELAAAGHPKEIVEDAVYAQCALLDEAALSSLAHDERAAWEHEPLQVRYFNSHDAGQQLIARIEQRLAATHSVLPLLAIFAAILALGFKGKFLLHDSEARIALMQALDARLGRDPAKPASGTVLVTHHKPAWSLSRLSIVGWLAVAGAIAGIGYFALHQWLVNAIAQLAH